MEEYDWRSAHHHKGKSTALLFHLCYYLVMPDWYWGHNRRTNSSTAQTDRAPTVTAVTELPSVPTASTSLPLHVVTFHISFVFPLQGSIQQLVIKDDPRVAEEQCEDDDPYVRHSVTCCNANLSNTKPKCLPSDILKCCKNLHVNQQLPLVVKITGC